jgi:ribonuclease P protein component
VPKSAGGAVQRNRIKRRLRELWALRAEVVAPGCDYVLVVRPGLIEAAEAQGSTWLGERLDELLAKAGAA